MPENSNLSPRELVQWVLENGVTDRIPKGELCITDGAIRKVMRVPEAGFTEKKAFAETMGLDIYSLSPQYPQQEKSLPTKKEYLWPELKNWTVDSPYFIFAVLDGAFEWGMRLLGFQEFCSNLRSPLVMEALVEQVENLNFYMIEKLAAEGVNGFILADDIAHQQGLFARPQVFQEFFIPSLARQVEQILRLDLPVFYHSDGNYRAVISDIINTGVSGLECLEKTAGMHIKELQALLGPQVCLWGHLDTDDLEAAAQDASLLTPLLDNTLALAQGKRFILGTTSGLFEGMQLEVLQELYASV
ncbi:MAG TPA: uroporphyrinogen decarboxylase family protein [Oscillospiraceae bacterium]|nr:uroporphyrinogen decarboxylase family protein [Oscillospiraceae bacterium]